MTDAVPARAWRPRLASLVATLWALLLGAGMAQAQTPADAACQSAGREALRAVEADSADALRTRLRAALQLRPSNALARLTLAALHRHTYDHANARREFRLLLATRGEDLAGTRRCAHLGIGGSFLVTSDLDSVDVHASAALRDARTHGDRHAEVYALLQRGRVVQRRHGVDSAVALLEQAEDVVPEGDLELRARVRCQRAMLARLRSTTAADSLVAQGLALARRSGAMRAEAGCLLVQGNVEDYSGRHTEAARTLFEAERLARAARDTDQLGVILETRALVAWWTSEYAEGRRAAEEALATVRRTGNGTTAAWALVAQSWLALKLGDVGTADSLARAAERTMRRLRSAQGLGATYDLLGETAWLSRRLPEAYRQFELGARAYREAGVESAISRMRRMQAGVLRELGQPGPAAAHLEEAVALATRYQIQGVLAAALYERGLAALAARDWDAAIRHLEQFMRGVEASALHRRYDVHLRLAEAHSGAGRLDAAERELALANGLLVQWRGLVSDRSARLALQSGVRLDYDPDLGLATVVSRLARAGRERAALAAVEDRRAQHLWQQMMHRADLRGAGDAAPRPALTTRLDDLPAVLPDSTALAVFSTGRGGEPTTLFVATRRGVEALALPPGDSLDPPIERFTTLLAAGQSAPALARDLGHRLLDPVARAAGPGVVRLVIVADGPMHRLPFDALQLADGRVALERFAISLAPSARIARSWWTDPAPRARRGIVAFADPAYDPAAGLVRLAASGAEGRDIRSRVADVRLLTREAASEAALKQARLDALGVLHFATHARVRDVGLLESALYLSPGDGQDGRVGPEELAALRLGVDLVVLSACRTVGGAILSGEGVQGLTAPLLEAGARSVAATYWEVGDRSVAVLVSRLYAELAARRAVGDALWRAKRAARTAGTSPAVWAAFTLLGDPAARPDIGMRSATTATD